MGEGEIADREGVEPHHLRRHGVDRDLVGGGQENVFAHGNHRARPRSVADRGPVHHGEEAGVDLLLDREEVHQRFVDPGVGVMPAGGQQAAEGVLHRAGRGGVDVALDGRQVDDVGAEEELRDLDAVREHLRQREHLPLRLVTHPREVVGVAVVAHRYAVAAEHAEVAVEPLALLRVGDDRVVLDAHQVGEAGGAQREDRALELPRRGVGARVRVVPGDVVLEDGGGAGGKGILHAGQLAQAPEVAENGVGPGAQHRHAALHRAPPVARTMVPAATIHTTTVASRARSRNKVAVGSCAPSR